MKSIILITNLGGAHAGACPLAQTRGEAPFEEVEVGRNVLADACRRSIMPTGSEPGECAR